MKSVLRTTSLAASLAMALAVACSDATDRPPAGGGSPYGSSGGGPSGTGDASSDASLTDSGKPASLCEPMAQQGDLIGELRIVGDQPPALGGTITPGRYVLTSVNAYGPAQAGDAGDGGEDPSGGGPTGISARATLVVTATTLSFFGTRGPAASLPAEAASGFTYVVSGNALQMTPTCPTTGAQKTIPFSSVGGALVLFPDAQHREVYGPR